ncbi:hypothetical protein BB560_000406 [Smittium megazygosporum]|uniref:Uncharacterized protein n=1 Tax=Smittium megazygosporum TaxID=133381 RepID=A0A2T9ZKF2_9FUNG|nr:hypothetical protein BB560_000406 [Smittium megazygosporum]
MKKIPLPDSFTGYINNPPWPENSLTPIAFYLIVFPDAVKKRFLRECSGRVKKNHILQIVDTRLLRGISGNVLCRYCGKETKTLFQTFCDDNCVQEFTIRTQPKIVRQKLYERDNGVCALCYFPANTYFKKLKNSKSYEEAMKILDSLEMEISQIWKKKTKAIRDKSNWIADSKEKQEACKLITPGLFWEAAHITDVVDGGGICGLEGYRTLCVPCHEIETRNCDIRRNCKRLNIDESDFPPEYRFDTLKKNALGDKSSQVKLYDPVHLENFQRYLDTLSVFNFNSTQDSAPSQQQTSNNTDRNQDSLLSDVSDSDILLSIESAEYTSSSLNKTNNPSRMSACTPTHDKMPAANLFNSCDERKQNPAVSKNRFQKNLPQVNFNQSQFIGGHQNTTNFSELKNTTQARNLSLNNPQVVPNKEIASKFNNPYSEIECILLLKCVLIYGKSWSIIQKLYFPSRSPDSLSIKFNKLINSKDVDVLISESNKVDLSTVKQKLKEKKDPQNLTRSDIFATPASTSSQAQKFPFNNFSSGFNQPANVYEKKPISFTYPLNRLNSSTSSGTVNTWYTAMEYLPEVKPNSDAGSQLLEHKSILALSSQRTDVKLAPSDSSSVNSSAYSSSRYASAQSKSSSTSQERVPLEKVNFKTNAIRSTHKANTISATSVETATMLLSKPDKRSRNTWSPAETNALIEGYKKFGKNWAKIKSEYSSILADRTNVNIKDRYRTLSNSGIIT